MTPQELTEHLRRQLLFLKNSARLFDEGNEEEAVRIAVAIRVLLHDTGRSTSLLTHMGLKASLKLVSAAGSFTPAQLIGQDNVSYFPMTFGANIRYTKPHANAPEVLCSAWWTQDVYGSNGVTLTRSDVVLAAANKDGGAHVDILPDVKLNALKEAFWIKTTHAPDGTSKTEPVTNNHYSLLRQFAEELFCSRELMARA